MVARPEEIGLHGDDAGLRHSSNERQLPLAQGSETTVGDTKLMPVGPDEPATDRADGGVGPVDAIPPHGDPVDAFSRLLESEASPLRLAPSSPGLIARPALATRRAHLRTLGTRNIGLQLGERKLLQTLADLGIIGGGVLAIMLNSERSYDGTVMLGTLTAITLIWLFFAHTFDAYNIRVLQSSPRNAYIAAQTYLTTGAVYVLFATLTGGVLPVIRFRISEVFFGLLVLIPLLLVRSLYPLLLVRAPLRRRVAVVGANETGFEMVRTLTQYGGSAYEFMGYFEEKPRPLADPPPDASAVLPTTELLGINESVGLDQIVLATTERNPRLLQTLSLCHERGIQITPMFALYQDLTGRVPVEHLGHDWFVALPAHRKSTPYLFIKRLVDMTLASTALLLTLPLFPLVALAVRLDSRGPILFKQPRVGAGGRLFKILKFRSMTADAEARTGAVWAQRQDKRITRIGRFLRKSRLDELPQLWNILIGEMSFVGPRPERPEFDEKLEQAIPFYRARRAVRPGLTGWAQVRHGYGNTMQDALRKVEYDLYYIKNESLYLDLVIILRTVAVVLKLGGT